MNSARRKLISDQITKLRFILTDVQTAQEEEQDYYDNMPESIQASEKGDLAQTAIDSLETASQSLEEAISELETVE